MCKSILVLIICVSVAPQILIAAPVRKGKDVIFIPGNRIIPIPPHYKSPYPQERGPFDFFTNWIQSQGWFPIEINIPSLLSGIGNGFQNGITSIQNGLQMVGSNVSNIAGSFFQRIPAMVNVVAGVDSPNRAPEKVFIMLPGQRNGATGTVNYIPPSSGGKFFHNDIDKLSVYP